MEQQKYIEKIAIEEKLKTAQSLRDENIKKMLERLKEHVSLLTSTRKIQTLKFRHPKEHSSTIYSLFIYI